MQYFVNDPSLKNQKEKIMIEKNLSKVPEITLIFWIIKILSTTVGETGADFLSDNIGFGLSGTSLVMSIVLAGALFIQFRLKRYVAASYWFVVIMMSIVGTLITDLLVDGLGVSLITLSIIFTIAMVGIFIIWNKKEHTLSIHSITTPKREIYYWVIVLIAFALGTGVGDLLSEKIDLGYTIALILFFSVIVIATLAHFWLKMDATLTFWVVFILTRPVGASLGDLLIQPASNGGMGLGINIVNIIFFSLIIAFIAYLGVSKKDVVKEINRM